MLGQDGKITLPLIGQDGDWIAKFPSSTQRELPENEHGMLRWANLALGLRTPEDPDHAPPTPIRFVGMEFFDHLARHAGVPPDLIAREVRVHVERARQAWPTIRPDVPAFVRATPCRRACTIAAMPKSMTRTR